MIISKAVVLNREESTEVDAYNKLLKQYHEAVFFDLTEASISKKKSQSYDELMSSFRSHFSTKVVKAEKSNIKIKDDFSNVSMKTLGDTVKKVKKDKQK